MARMIPPEPERFRSPAEKRVFHRIRDELPNEWQCIYSVSLCEMEDKKNGETDFLLIGPQGIFCLEVKGGRVFHLKNGYVQYINGKDQVTTKRQGPFEQVIDEYWAIIKTISEKVPQVRHQRVTGYGVVLPDTRYEPPAKNTYIREAIYDDRDQFQKQPFLQYVNRLAAYWRSRYLQEYRRLPALLSAEEIEASVQSVWNGGYQSDNLKDKRLIIESQFDIEEYTKQQFRVLKRLSINDRMLIRGGAGTGKTVLAYETAVKKAVDGKNVLLCCYNKYLANHLKNLADKSEVLSKSDKRSNLRVFNLHTLMYDFIEKSGLLASVRDLHVNDLMAVEYPRLFVEALKALGAEGVFDVIVIDEAQDLLFDNYIKAMNAALKGGFEKGSWYIFYDPFQCIFGGDISENIQQLRAYGAVDNPLEENCRNTRTIGEVCRALSGFRIEDLLKIEGPEIKKIFYRNQLSQYSSVSAEIGGYINIGISPADIIILSKYRLNNTCFKEGTIAGTSYRVKEYEKCARDENCVRFSTVQSFKGLESLIVVYIDIDKIYDDSEIIYVGTSRAKSKLILSIAEDQRDSLNKRYDEYTQWMLDRSRETGGEG